MEALETRELRDITPNPRILRTLGEIPFSPWQCIAELVDNALDISRRSGVDAVMPSDTKKRVIVSWSSENVAAADRQLEVTDTGPGMDLDAIQESARAGYTNKESFDNLGLFGMGFNIATARLGERTLFLSATADAPEYVGIEIDFAELIKSGVFKAPTIRIPKTRKDEHGTRVIVQKLKPSIFAKLRESATQIREILSDIYSPILRQGDVEVMVQSKILSPRLHCTWGASRYVSLSRGNINVPAILDVDEVLGETLYDVNKGRYLSPEEDDEARREQKKTGAFPLGIMARIKKIHGWLGVQRYPDTDDFGVDFIRNGRKILRRDKSLFYFENSLTGNRELEYPVELGATVGGRIVGEIHIDHVPPTYQKNDFDRTEPSWHEVVETLRGNGPIRPKIRKALAYTDENTSPLGRLVRAYGVVDQGTKHLVAAPHDEARKWARKFREGDLDYQTDEKWFEAAREADRRNADKDARKREKTDPGASSSDDISTYLPAGAASSPTGDSPSSTANVSPTAGVETAPTTGPQVPQEEPIEALKRRSRASIIDSHDYSYPGCKAQFMVTTWELTSGKIGEGEEGDPCILFKDGPRCDFFYNPRHPFLRDYPVTHKDLLLISLAERFKVRDNLQQEISVLFAGLVIENSSELKFDLGRMQETANTFFDRIREKAPELLSLREQEVIDYVHEATGEVEEIANRLLGNTDLLRKFQSRTIGAVNALALAPARTLVRLMDGFPEEFFDGKFFAIPYTAIDLQDPNSTQRLRNESKERLLSFLKDALWVISESRSSSRQQKAELARCAHSLNILQQEIEL